MRLYSLIVLLLLMMAQRLTAINDDVKTNVVVLRIVGLLKM